VNKVSAGVIITFLLSSYINLPAQQAEVVLENCGAATGLRWLDVADQEYASGFQSSYSYDNASVQITYSKTGAYLSGTLTAANLKPNFAYQLKLVADPGTPSNELIGYSGRWWEQEWEGSSWSTGWNLNNKGDGSSPNPNDLVYKSRKDITDPTSPTGLKYKYTGYRVLDYFITDENGNASFSFIADSSYHVLWKESQRTPESGDGPVGNHTFDPDPETEPAYDTDYGESTVGVYGEWERLPANGVPLVPGMYDCRFLLTEESFHGSGLAGWWAHAMQGDVTFSTASAPDPPVQGINFTSWQADQYNTAESDTSLSQLADTGANWASILVTQYQDNIHSTVIYADPLLTPTDTSIEHAIDTAHNLGINVMLRVHIDLSNDPSHWRGQISFSTGAAWRTWFNNYETMIVHYAQLAEQKGVEMLCVGTELSGTQHRENNWRDVIDAVKAVYSGSLTYGANHDAYDTGSIAWWDALDYIGIDAYFNLTSENDPTVAEIMAEWDTILPDIESLAQTLSMPVLFAELGYRSCDGANKAPWYWGGSEPVDLQEQKDCYEAAFLSLWDKTWFYGIFWWNWDPDPDYGSDPGNTDYTPHHKPAEDILTEWLTYEQNDTAAEAYDLSADVIPGSGDFVSGNLKISTGGDEDWYMLNLSVYTELQVDVLFSMIDQDTDLGLALYDSALDLIASSESEDSNESISAEVLPGVYYIRVWGADNSGSGGTGPSVNEYVMQISACAPLNWTGEAGYASEGLDPETGDSKTEFTYRVKYTNSSPPSWVKLYVDRNGDGDYTDTDEMLDMAVDTEAPDPAQRDGDYTNGEWYALTTTIPCGPDTDNCSYYFEADTGIKTVNTAIMDAPDILLNIGEGTGENPIAGDGDQNDTIYYSLQVTKGGAGTADITLSYEHIDYDWGAVLFYEDTDSNGVYDSGTDPEISGPQITLGQGETMHILAAVSIPGDATDGDFNTTRITASFNPSSSIMTNTWVINPLYVELADLRAEQTEDGVLVSWMTVFEADNIGFNVYVRDTDSEYVKANTALIPSQYSGFGGAEYSFLVTGLTPGKTYLFMVEDIDVYGKGTFHGPVRIGESRGGGDPDNEDGDDVLPEEEEYPIPSLSSEQGTAGGCMFRCNSDNCFASMMVVILYILISCATILKNRFLKFRN